MKKGAKESKTTSGECVKNEPRGVRGGCLAASLLVVTVRTETASVVVRWKPASQLPKKSAASPGAET